MCIAENVGVGRAEMEHLSPLIVSKREKKYKLPLMSEQCLLKRKNVTPKAARDYKRFFHTLFN